jgi:hypothetical protein
VDESRAVVRIGADMLQALVIFEVSLGWPKVARELRLGPNVLGRLVRLIPEHENDKEMSAVKLLFEHRLDVDPMRARSDWLDIVESRSLLWGFISSPKRELIRSVLNTLNVEIVKRARPPNVFNFASASVGNMFLAGYVTKQTPKLSQQ